MIRVTKLVYQIGFTTLFVRVRVWVRVRVRVRVRVTELVSL